jgi:hypothetical protein
MGQGMRFSGPIKVKTTNIQTKQVINMRKVFVFISIVAIARWVRGRFSDPFGFGNGPLEDEAYKFEVDNNRLVW